MKSTFGFRRMLIGKLSFTPCFFGTTTDSTIFSISTSSWSSKDWNLSTMNDPAWSLPTPFFWSRLAGSCFYQCKIKEVGRQSVPWSGQARVQICQGWPELMRGALILLIFQITWRLLWITTSCITSKISGFAKYGFEKLPISILYPALLSMQWCCTRIIFLYMSYMWW